MTRDYYNSDYYNDMYIEEIDDDDYGDFDPSVDMTPEIFELISIEERFKNYEEGLKYPEEDEYR